MTSLELCHKNKGRHYADRSVQLLVGGPCCTSGPSHEHGSEPASTRPMLDLCAVEFE